MTYGTLTGEEWNYQFRHEMPISQIRKGQIDPHRPEYTAADWISGKEIRVSAMPGIDGKAIDAVMQGFEELIDELHLDLKVSFYEADSTVTEPIEEHTSSHGLDYEQLALAYALEPYRKENQHADVVLTDAVFDDDKTSWGYSKFSTGTAIFALAGKRKESYSFLKNVAKHEAAHLLGYNIHHDDVEVPELESKECVMDYSVPTEKLCDKCFNALNAYWHGLEDITGMSFIRDDSPYKLV